MALYSIAIDGPAGAGKSTIAKEVARQLGFEYIDTGAMYRAVTYQALMLGIKLEDESAYGFIDQIEIKFHGDKVFMGEEDITRDIRSIEVTNNVSLVSSFLTVREKLVALQRKIAKKNSVVMDGRDIGSNVLTDATLKIFLTATIDKRALRRFKELEERKISTTYEQVVNDIIRRDHYDTNRLYNPLTKADDAYEIDTSEMKIEEVCKKILHLFKEQLNHGF